tara:strand:+ start:207 stop:512 length:306 start_codon:yes stop_codon:yes gene_type:complete
MEVDMAPEPVDIMTVMRAPTGHGWMIAFDGHPQAYFSTVADLCSWINTALKPLDYEAGVIPRDEPNAISTNDPLPAMFKEAQELIEQKPSRLWRVFAGGRA